MTEKYNKESVNQHPESPRRHYKKPEILQSLPIVQDALASHGGGHGGDED